MRFVTVCVAALAWSASALGQEPAPDPPREDGLGPYQFGMSMDAVRALSPNANWRVEAAPGDGEGLLGGPRVAIAGARFATLLAFDGGVLDRIVLFGASQGACVEVVTALVEELEPAYGAFHGAPGLGEEGRVVEVRHTHDGSEVRVRETDDGPRRTVGSSRRRAAMLLQVTGEANEGDSAATCRLQILFDHEVVQVPPEAQALFDAIDRAETMVMDGPPWIERPDAAAFARAYPPQALQHNEDGRAVLDCIVLADGRLDCLVMTESPPGSGFGGAALRIATHFRTRTDDEHAWRIGKRVRVPIRFQS